MSKVISATALVAYTRCSHSAALGVANNFCRVKAYHSRLRNRAARSR